MVCKEAHVKSSYFIVLNKDYNTCIINCNFYNVIRNVYNWMSPTHILYYMQNVFY